MSMGGLPSRPSQKSSGYTNRYARPETSSSGWLRERQPSTSARLVAGTNALRSFASELTSEMPYKPQEIEPHWQRYWEEHRTFEARELPGRTKFYALDMFPYPSGKGLHVGHPAGYTASDVVSRYRRAIGAS